MSHQAAASPTEPAIGRSLAERVERLAPGGLMVLEFHHLLPLLVDASLIPPDTGTGRTSRWAR